jgi:hypothetical protein
MLDESLDVFANPDGEQSLPTKQDIVYQGNIAKWAKLANSLKLKIAVRLLHQDKAKAIQIAQDVATNKAGVLDGVSDDLFFSKGVREYNFTDAIGGRSGVISKPIADFMVSHLDPRIRFISTKNRYNSKIVQAFFDQEAKGGTSAKLPAYILVNVNYTTEGNKKIFKSWKAPGEPWVRYYGLPTEKDAKTETAKYGDYFDKNRWKIGPSDGEKSFTPYSIWHEEMVRGNIHASVPTVPGGPVLEDLEDHGIFIDYFSTAEVNLYFAEFKLLGANLPKSAQEYLSAGIKASVEAFDRAASLNKIPYYGTTYAYDENEKVIDLQPGEIDTLLANPDYQLTGSATDQLEKVYIQQFLHFMFSPNDQYVSVRRSGVPKVGSSLLPWNPIVESNQIPRRMEITEPSPTSLMYNIEMASYKEQGFTPGKGKNNPALLNAERVWQDKGAPQFGEGPNF